jgi:DNA polymerase beta
MNKKQIIISKLEDLKKIYLQDESKKWNLKALSNAINEIKKYNGDILSGEQLKNEIKGIGEKISKRINEILLTNDLKELKDLTPNQNPNLNIENILLITGVGPVRAKKWISMGIKDIDDVKKFLDEKKITSTHHIDIGIKYYYDFQKKIPRDEINKIKIFINDSIKKVDNNFVFEICGSYRRGNNESSDIDILISNPSDILISNPNENTHKCSNLQKIIKELIKRKFIIDKLTLEGNTKFMGVCKLENYTIPRRIDIRYVHYSSYYTSLLYFTGSKDFNIYLRNKALENNYSLNEYCLTNLNNNTITILNNEKEIFDIFKIPYLTPKERNMN